MNRRIIPFLVVWALVSIVLLTAFASQHVAGSAVGQAAADPTQQWQTVQAAVDQRFTQTAEAGRVRSTLEPTAAFVATVDAAFHDALAATQTAETPPQPTGGNARRDIFREPLGQAQSARIVIDIPLAQATITTQAGSEDLITADLTYIGVIDFYAVGEEEKFIMLTNPVHTLPLTGVTEDLPWHIVLNPAVPLNLEINVGVGRDNVFDFTGLEFGELLINTGVGDTHVTLPVGGLSYLAGIHGGAGNVTVVIPTGAAIALDISGGVGAITLELGEEAVVRLEASWGVGSVTVPDRFEQVSLSTGIVGGEGVWQTPHFDRAERQVIITYHGGVGNLTVR